MKRTKSQIAIINAALELFKKQGFRKLSVEEISEAANVSKMTFYRHFSSKINVVTEVLKELIDKANTDYHAIMESDETFPEKVKAFIKYKEENANEFGELFINDIYQVNEPELQNMLAEASQKSIDIFLKDLVKAQKEGWVRKDLKPAFIHHMLNVILQESQSDALREMYPHSKDLAHETLSFLFYGIMNSDQ